MRPVAPAMTTLLLAAAALSGCAHVAPAPTLAWSSGWEDHFSAEDFADSVLTREAVVLTRNGLVVALDPATGERRWERTAAVLLHPRGASRPLWAVGGDESAPGDGSSTRPLEEAVALDPVTGAVLRRVRLGQPIRRTIGVRLALAGHRLLVLDDFAHALRAIELDGPNAGAVAWERPSIAAAQFPPLVLADRVIFPGPTEPTYIAHALDDGRELFRVPGVCCTAMASPDGRHVYLRGGVDETIAIGGDGSIGARLRGTPQAVSASWVAVESPGVLAVHRHGEATPRFELRTTDPDFTTAAALAGDWLFYYRGRDATLWRRDLASGAEQAMLVVRSKFVLSPDATGVAPAILTTPPVFDPPMLFIFDWTIRGYRVP